MNTKLVVLVLGLGVVGGAGYGLRTYLHNADPSVRAERLANEGKLRDAMVELRTASRNNPRDADLHVRIAQLQAKLADPVAAEREYRTALQLGADRVAVAPELGEQILVQGRFRDVLRDLPPRAPTPAVLAKILLLRAVAQLSLDDLAGAQTTLADAEARVPNQAETALIAARIAAARNDLPVMQAKVADVLRLDPNQVEALLMQEKMKTLDGDRPAALALADRAVAAAPWSAMARIERAGQLIYAGDDKKAQADVNAVLQAQPRFMDAVYLNGILMARRGLLVEAAAQLEKLDAVSARIPQGLYYQSLIAMQQGNLQTAAEYARRYTVLVPQDPDGLRAVARTELALGHPAAALPALAKLTGDAPKDAESFDMLGRADAALNKGAEAAKAFETAVTLAPADPLFRYHYGAQQLQTGRAAEAVKNLEQAFAAEPKINGLGTALIESYLSVGNPAKADDAIARIRAVSGDTDELTLFSALVRIRQSDLPGARTVLTEGIRKYPASSDLRTQLALVLTQQGQTGDAATLLTAVLAKEPTKLAALSAYIDLKASSNELPASIAMLEAAHRAAPRNPAITSMLADGLTANKEGQRAIDMIREGGADSGLPPLVAGALGRAQITVGRSADALETFRAALVRQPDDLLVRGQYAALLTTQKDFSGVAATLREALAIYPGNYTLMSGLVANEARWKGTDAATKVADELRAQPGAMPFAAALKGDLFMAAGRPADAAQAYMAEYAKEPNVPMLVKGTGALSLSKQDAAATQALNGWLADHPADAEAAARLAQIDIQSGRYADAQTHLGVVLAARPNDASALNNLAWSYFMAGDSRALPTAQRAYLQSPNPLAADTLGWVLVKNGSAKAAIPVLQRSVDQRPDRSTSYHLAVALAEDGRTADAIRTLQPLLEGPAFAEQDAARKLAGSLKEK